jgi:hypothetical protein
MAGRDEIEIVAEQLSAVSSRVEAIETRLVEIDKVVVRLEGAALTTARALQEISHHWDAVYEAMRRIEEPGVSELRRELYTPRPDKRET